MARNGAGVTVRAVRRVRVLEARVQGRSLRAIAAELGCAPATAMRDLHHALDELARLEQERTAEHRALELARLDHLLVMLADKIDAGDVGAINAALRISERRSRLLGLDRAAGEADKPDVSALLAVLAGNGNGERRLYDA